MPATSSTDLNHNRGGPTIKHREGRKDHSYKYDTTSAIPDIHLNFQDYDRSDIGQ